MKEQKNEELAEKTSNCLSKANKVSDNEHPGTLSTRTVSTGYIYGTEIGYNAAMQVLQKKTLQCATFGERFTSNE
ncbi:hypothetical protein [Bacteroides fluxus]